MVVDPGVGTARRPILMEAAGQYFVAPDNGVLAMVYAREKHKIRLISNEKLFRQPVSRTFHGRDIFAPVAAHLAGGVAPARMGKLIEDYLRPAFEKPQRTGKRTWTGRILKIDRFGNIVTNFHVDDFPDLERRISPWRSAPAGRRAGAQLRRVRSGRAVPDRGQLGISGGLGEPGIGGQTIGCQTGAPAELMIEGSGML